MGDRLFSARRLPGRLVRFPLRLIPRGTIVPILGGPARGLKWIVGSGPHSCWMGLNEIRKQRVFANHVMPGAVVYDIGANVGIYTLIAARRAGPSGQVVAFEPLPDNVRYLQRHVHLNNLRHVRVEQSAAWREGGLVRFVGTPDRVRSHVRESGDLEVRAVSIDGLLATGDLRPPTCLKIDVEGSEVQVLEGARATVQAHHPVIFLATHGPDFDTDCRAILGEQGYAVRTIPGHPDELIAQAR